MKRFFLLIPFEARAALFLILFSLMAGLLFSYKMGTSLLLGGSLALGNLWLIERSVYAFVGVSGSRPGILWVFALLKYPLVLGVLGLAFLKMNLNPVGFVVGFLGMIVLLLNKGMNPRASSRPYKCCGKPNP